MGSIRLIQKPVNGQIVFNVPDEMRDETIVIEFRPAKQEDNNPSLAEASRSFFNKLQRPETDFDFDSLNVYEQ